MTTQCNPQTKHNVRTAAMAVRALINGGIVDPTNARSALVQVAKVLISTDIRVHDQVQAAIKTLKTPKKRRAKSTKPRKVTAYNMFIQNNRDALRAELQSASSGDSTSKKRGGFMCLASKKWRALGEDERVRFQTLADEANAARAKTRAAEAAAAAVKPITVPATASATSGSTNCTKDDWNALLGVKTPKEATHECPHCTRTFKGAKWLGNHITKRHSDNGSGNDSDTSNTSNGSC